jgi:hypothetical protein
MAKGDEDNNGALCLQLIGVINGIFPNHGFCLADEKGSHEVLNAGHKNAKATFGVNKHSVRAKIPTVKYRKVYASRIVHENVLFHEPRRGLSDIL